MMSVTSTPSTRARVTHGAVSQSPRVTPPSAREGCPPRRRGFFHLRGGPARRSGGRRDGSRRRLGRLDGGIIVAFTRAVSARIVGERMGRARMRPGDANDDARIGVGSGVVAEPPGRRGGRTPPTTEASREARHERARIANRGSPTPVRPMSRASEASDAAATRRRSPAFRMRDRGGATAASGRGTSLARATMCPARDGRWLSYTFRATEDVERSSARSLRRAPGGGHRGGGVPTRPGPGPGRAWHRVGDAAGGPREGHFGGTGGSGGGECRITIARAR